MRSVTMFFGFFQVALDDDLREALDYKQVVMGLSHGIERNSGSSLRHDGDVQQGRWAGSLIDDMQ